MTAAALRAAQGTVRCGCCGSAFDALQSLSDTLPDEPDAATPFAPVVDEFGMDLADDGGSANDPIVTEFHFSADDIEQVFSEARDWNRHFDDAAVNAAEANGVGREPRAPL
ncbi:MAG: hypothetical protein ACR2I8_04000, partial [Steroidobacteraceae bacterium]